MFKPYIVDEFGVKNWNNLFLLCLPALFLIFVIFLGGNLIYYFESGVENSMIANSDDSYWLSHMAATTVGFGDIYPVTLGGRIVVGTIAALGICIFSAIGNYFSLLIFSKFDTEVQNRELRRQNAEIIELAKEIVRTNQECIDGNSKIHEDLLNISEKK